MSVYALGSLRPRLAADVWIAPTATVVGDVEIGAQSSVWFGAVIRGDINHIRIGARSNVQDNSVLHVADGCPCIIGDDVLVGHTAIIHGCTLHDRAFIGMGATVLNAAVIEAGGMLAAGGLLTGGKRIGPNEMWAGAPARFVRKLTDAERAEYDRQTTRYVHNAQRFRTEMV